MNSLNYRTLFLSLIFLNLLTFTQIKGQVASKENKPTLTDSVELDQVLKEVIKNYPSVKEAEEAINSTDAKIGLAKSGYYPDIDVTAGFSHIGPVSTLTIPGLGSMQLYP